jgi:hypothetical protein
MNWTGIGVVFPRERWHSVKSRQEFSRTGVYILVGYSGADDELPTVYVGEGDVVRDRLESHYQKKDFWTHGYVFVTSNSGLNKAHVRWLEHALVQQAIKASRSKLDNGTEPQEPPLTEADRADSRAFLEEVLQVLPIMGLRVFEKPKPVAMPQQNEQQGSFSSSPTFGKAMLDTVIVPAQEEGFRQVFLGENRWYAIRIAGGMLQRLRYIAAYQTAPISAITHFAPIKSIEPYGEQGKYQLIFTEPARQIEAIPFGDAVPGSMQGPRYTSHERLLSAKKLSDLL